MRCNHCDHLQEQAGHFCEKCGRPIEAVRAPQESVRSTSLFDHHAPTAPPPVPRARRVLGMPLWGVAALGAAVLATGGGLGLVLSQRSGTTTVAPPIRAAAKPTPYARLVSGFVARLGRSGSNLTRSMTAAERVGDLQEVRRVASTERQAADAALRQLTNIHPSATDLRSHRLLLAAAGEQRRFAGSIVIATSDAPSVAIATLPRAKANGQELVSAWGAFFGATPSVPDTVTGGLNVDLSHLEHVLRDDLAPRVVTVVQQPPANGVPSDGTGITSDVVAFSNGEGVRYRYSTNAADKVPGNGPFEGDVVTVYCYTSGDSVRGNSYWAKVSINPERYVPATYLRAGNGGSVPGGVPYC